MPFRGSVLIELQRKNLLFQKYLLMARKLRWSRDLLLPRPFEPVLAEHLIYILGTNENRRA